ncbi:hypothetical protein A7E77_00370 [Sphingomonas sp. NIC1]|nr:hypothetical protein A7E77_00370 [Sphingomonas sp. NIC1]
MTRHFTHVVTEQEVQQVRDLIILRCQYTDFSAFGAVALRTVNRLWEASDIPRHLDKGEG